MCCAVINLHYSYKATSYDYKSKATSYDYKSIQAITSIVNLLCLTGVALKVFNIGKNDIYDDGMEMIFKTLQNNESLTKLCIEQCGLSAKGILASMN